MYISRIVEFISKLFVGNLANEFDEILQINFDQHMTKLFIYRKLYPIILVCIN